jgi:hypothetical protein
MAVRACPVLPPSPSRRTGPWGLTNERVCSAAPKIVYTHLLHTTWKAWPRRELGTTGRMRPTTIAIIIVAAGGTSPPAAMVWVINWHLPVCIPY